jgi:hypothetical protein
MSPEAKFVIILSVALAGAYAIHWMIKTKDLRASEREYRRFKAAQQKGLRR